MVVEVALDELRRLDRSRRRSSSTSAPGSGAIALSLAAERARTSRCGPPTSSADALAVARANLAGLGAPGRARVRLLEGIWFDALPDELRGRVDVVVSNPPYVADGEPLPAEVADWEPASARCVAGPTGLEAIERDRGRGARVAGAARRALVRRDRPRTRPSAAAASATRPASTTSRCAPTSPDGRGLSVGLTDGDRGTGGRPAPAEALEGAVEVLRAGPSCLPTDTVYGLAVDPFLPGASDRVFELKRRPRDENLPVLVASTEQALGLATAVPETALALMARFWPGALTHRAPGPGRAGRRPGRRRRHHRRALPRPPCTPAPCAGPWDRWPRRAPTSTASRRLTTAAEVAEAFGDTLPVVLDGGPCTGSPSTVVDCTGVEPKLLDEGRIAWDDVLAALA